MMTFVGRCAVPAQFGKHGLHRRRKELRAVAQLAPSPNYHSQAGAHDNPPLPLDCALRFPMMDQFGPCRRTALSTTSTNRHVTGLSSGGEKEARHGPKISTASGEFQSMPERTRPNESFCRKVVSVASPMLPLTDPRRSAAARIALVMVT